MMMVNGGMVEYFTFALYLTKVNAYLNVTSTSKVLVSCSDTYFETDFQTFELFQMD